MSLKEQFTEIKIEKEKPTKSSMFCKIDYDIAEKVRDYKHQQGLRLDKVLEELLMIGLKEVEKKKGKIKSRV